MLALKKFRDNYLNNDDKYIASSKNLERKKEETKIDTHFIDSIPFE